MSSSAVPKPGVDYRVVLGDSLLETPGTSGSTYAILRYDFKPASVDRSREGMVQVHQGGRQIVHSLPTVNADEPEIHYQGRFDGGNELDCVAIFDGKGGFRLERILGQAYLRHTNMRTLKREPNGHISQPQVTTSSPNAEPAQTTTVQKSTDRPEQHTGDADAEAFDAELEAELERGLFEDADDDAHPATTTAPPESSAPPVAQPPPNQSQEKEQEKTAPPGSPMSTGGAAHSSSSDSSDSSDSDDEASPKPASPKAAVPQWPAAQEKAEPMNELEREFLGIPAAVVQPPPQPAAHQSDSSSSDSSSSDSSSSDSSSSDSSDDEDIHKCSDDESEGKDVEWF